MKGRWHATQTWQTRLTCHPTSTPASKQTSLNITNLTTLDILLTETDKLEEPYQPQTPRSYSVNLYSVCWYLGWFNWLGYQRCSITPFADEHISAWTNSPNHYQIRMTYKIPWIDNEFGLPSVLRQTICRWTDICLIQFTQPIPTKWPGFSP